MIKRILACTALCASIALSAQPSGRVSWNDGWTFTKDGSSRILNLPHDWGVESAFAQELPGETGKLPWWGKASYSKQLTLNAEDLSFNYRLEVDGAFSDSKVLVNGELLGGRPYGYSSYAVDMTPALREGANTVEITLDNKSESSRWYPGGGIYRNVWITRSRQLTIDHWGVCVTTPVVSPEKAVVRVRTRIRTGSQAPCSVTLSTTIGQVSAVEVLEGVHDGDEVTQELELPAPELWSPERPRLYELLSTVSPASAVPAPVPAESYRTLVGIRSAEWKADGFYLNGSKTFLKGVCLHHDAGALGAVWNEDAWIRRLLKLKEMGCNAIRCSHNPPAPELLDLCDSMGFLVIDELTDTWTVPKKDNGYATLFAQWAEKDLTDMIRRDRNHPCVIAWSIGNECGEQGMPDKWDIPMRLTAICHKEDPTRPTTAGNDNPWAASQNYARTIDVYGFNYKPHLYKEFRDSHPGQPFYGSETASCISTRGWYRFPVAQEKDGGWDMSAPFQVSSYDLYAPAWASKPDYEWQYEDEVPECAGEFVWTGYDYLGEPTPFNMDPSVLTNFHTEEEREAFRKMVAGWGQQVSDVPLPSRSSYFGIMDLAGFPKDRFWLYQARWRPELRVAHILPHWTWPGREGEVTPVHVYTSGDEAELFLNGRSLGRKAREGYRIVWDDVVYQPGTLEVICYKDGQKWAWDRVVTAGAPARLELEVNYSGSGLTYVSATVTDRKGRPVPGASPVLKFSVTGGEFVAADSGDPTSHIPFSSRELPAFGGLCSVILKTVPGTVLTVESQGLRGAMLTL